MSALRFVLGDQLSRSIPTLRGIDPAVADLSSTALAATVRDWLAPHLLGTSRLADASKLDLHALLRGLLGWEHASRLDRDLPPYLTLPGGRAAIEARLALGETFAAATRPLVKGAVRRGMVPILNQMSAAGLVTLPGIMTGQILAGMDPLDAVKYQILLMFLLAGASGLAAVTVALLTARRFTDERQRLRLDRLR